MKPSRPEVGYGGPRTFLRATVPTNNSKEESMRIAAVLPLALACLALACQPDATGPSGGPWGPSAPSPDPRDDPQASTLVATACADCVFGPTTYTGGTAGPQVFIATIPTVAGGQYSVEIDDAGIAGSDGSVVLNGVTLMAKRTPGEVGARRVVVQVTLDVSNTFLIRITGKKGTVRLTVRSLCGATTLPNPTIALQEIRPDIIDGFARNVYVLNVTNSASYPDRLFAEAPALPPCGLNASASRTWVEMFADRVRVGGSCVLNSAASLNRIYFVTDAALPAPTSASIQLVDRMCGIIYESDALPLPVPK